MLTSMHAIQQAVRSAPGHTAYWYMTKSGQPVRRNWLYSAFERTANAGLIEPHPGPRKGQTVYYPAQSA